MKRIPPAAVVLLIAALMYGQHHYSTDAALEVPGSGWAALALLAAGLGVTVAGIASFRSAHTTVDPREPEKAASLVVAGIYHRTRNPMYLGMVLCLYALAFYLANPFLLFDPLFFVLYMNRYQIPAEEAALAAKFGAEYEAYRRRVRRWL